MSGTPHPDWPFFFFFYRTHRRFINAHDSVDCAANIIFNLYALIPKSDHTACTVTVRESIILIWWNRNHLEQQSSLPSTLGVTLWQHKRPKLLLRSDLQPTLPLVTFGVYTEYKYVQLRHWTYLCVRSDCCICTFPRLWSPVSGGPIFTILVVHRLRVIFCCWVSHAVRLTHSILELAVPVTLSSLSSNPP